MNFYATKARVFNRGVLSDEFLTELVGFGKVGDDDIFARNNNYDIYNKVYDELGPYEGDRHRRAVLLEVLRVLALFESGGNWREGVDSSRRGDTTNENAEAGAWQVSWNNRKLDPNLATFLEDNEVDDGVEFQQRMKSDHMLAMEFIARLLRIDMKDYNRINNGPVRKGMEREATWPDRPKLWRADQSIYPWLSRDAVLEFEGFLA
jgi:hypothetical protein